MKWIAIASLAFLLTGCMASIRPTATSLNYVPEKMELTGWVTGQVTSTKILMLLPLDDDQLEYSTREAEAKALESNPRHPDAILNPLVEVIDESFLGVWTKQTVRVTGLSIRFVGEQWGQGPGVEMKREEASPSK